MKKLKRKSIDVSVKGRGVHFLLKEQLYVEKLYVITIHPICCVKKLRWEGKNLRQGGFNRI